MNDTADAAAVRSVLVIAGEISGDMHAAKLIRELKQRGSGIRFWGIGGEEMEAAGVELEYHVRDMAVLGLSEVIRRYGWFRKVFHHMLELAAERQPDAILLVDYPGFNLRFAKQIKKRLGTKVLYYISPQVWAWKASRIPKIAATVDRLMVILPFEVDCYAGHDLQVDFVGHPLVDEVAAARATERSELPWGGAGEQSGSDGLRLALLPGSRAQEVERILPVLVEVVKRLPPNAVRPLIAAASPELEPRVRELSGGLPVVLGQTREILLQAEFGLVASGTATLEAALCHCPMAVVYRTAAFTWFVGKRVVKLPNIGLANIVAGREAFREFLQDDADPAAIAAHVSEVALQPERLAEVRAATLEIESKLGGGSGHASLAEILLAEIK